MTFAAVAEISTSASTRTIPGEEHVLGQMALSRVNEVGDHDHRTCPSGYNVSCALPRTPVELAAQGFKAWCLCGALAQHVVPKLRPGSGKVQITAATTTSLRTRAMPPR